MWVNANLRLDTGNMGLFGKSTRPLVLHLNCARESLRRFKASRLRNSRVRDLLRVTWTPGKPSIPPRIETNQQLAQAAPGRQRVLKNRAADGAGPTVGAPSAFSS